MLCNIIARFACTFFDYNVILRYNRGRKRGGANMSVTTIRLNKQEEKLFQNYAELTGEPMSTLFKDALREKIEDYLDLQAGLEALQNLSGETISFEEAMKEVFND